jgi:hypothetical protein
LIIASAFYVYWSSQPIKVYYSDEPKKWIEKVDAVTNEINVAQVSKGQAYAGDMNLRFWLNGTETAFDYEGYYKGNYFTKNYVENGDVLMHVGAGMKPNDGVIDGLVVERVINDTYQVFIFLDNDWKNKMGYANIIWGSDYGKVRPFVFNEISPGIFMDQIEDDPERFALNGRVSYSGIIVGGITQEDVKKGVTKGKTLIIFQ